jgi:hypothetical protein
MCARAFRTTAPRARVRAVRAVRVIAATAVALSCMIGVPATAAAADVADGADDKPPSARDIKTLRTLSAPPGGFLRLSGALELGDGLRFNNPYRLSTELGQGSTSLSRTSSYLDLAASAVYGPARGLAQGFAVHLSLGLEGVSQQVVTPSYQVEWRRRVGTLFYGRLGTPIILAPDPSAGGELAFGAAYFFTGRIALAGELVGDLFYGAGTHARATTTYPILSAQLGVLFQQELLPW